MSRFFDNPPSEELVGAAHVFENISSGVVIGERLFSAAWAGLNNFCGVDILDAIRPQSPETKEMILSGIPVPHAEYALEYKNTYSCVAQGLVRLLGKDSSLLLENSIVAFGTKIDYVFDLAGGVGVFDEIGKNDFVTDTAATQLTNLRMWLILNAVQPLGAYKEYMADPTISLRSTGK